MFTPPYSTNNHGYVDSIAKYFNAHGISAGTGKALQKLKIIEKLTRNGYEWIGGVPNESMAHNVRKVNNSHWKKNHPKDEVIVQNEDPTKGKISIDQVYDNVIQGYGFALKYGVPDVHRKAFIKDLFLK